MKTGQRRTGSVSCRVKAVTLPTRQLTLPVRLEPSRRTPGSLRCRFAKNRCDAHPAAYAAGSPGAEAQHTRQLTLPVRRV